MIFFVKVELEIDQLIGCLGQQRWYHAVNDSKNKQQSVNVSLKCIRRPR